ncbi:MAG: plasmid mobilization relaxosome protein MobC [Betaproteobacteria bacterium]|nr:plasmid mobilization relaxosome protein MobC [Betaproteobacteria bacterium]
MGRKRKHERTHLTHTVSARLRADTFAIVTEHAERLGLTRSAYIEHLIENRPLKITRTVTDELSVPLVNELKRIGNNLNQMAHARNSDLPVDPAAFRTVLTDILAALCREEMLRRRVAAAAREVIEELSLRPKEDGSGTAETAPLSAELERLSAHWSESGRPPAPAAAAPLIPARPRQTPEPPSPSPKPEAAPPQARAPQTTSPAHDPEAQSPRPKFPWSLFVRASRRRPGEHP